jgi:hypothetical protein
LDDNDNWAKDTGYLHIGYSCRDGLWYLPPSTRETPHAEGHEFDIIARGVANGLNIACFPGKMGYKIEAVSDPN